MKKTLVPVAKTSGHARQPRSSELAPPITLPKDPLRTDHFVQFYEDDTFLVSSVGRFIEESLRAGGNAITISTPDHSRGIAAHLRAAGLDPDELQVTGHYVALDAAETLRRLMFEGMPDAKRFNAVIGSQVSRYAGGPGKLRMFGEMVALLWSQGNSEAALRLEELWNDLGERYVFSLFCGYPLSSFADDSSGTSFRHVCGAHTCVLPSENYGGTGQSAGQRLHTIAILQQKAAALEAEIKERQRIEAELRRSQNELSAFLEGATVGLHRASADGTILWANPAELEMLGYSNDEYIGHNIREFHADAPVIDDILFRIRQGEKLRNYEARLRCKNGFIKRVLIDSSVLWDNGKFVHTQCFTRDVTEQHETGLQSRRLAAIVESSDDAIISKTLEGRIMSWNQSAERIFGYTATEAIGRNITMLIPTELLNEEPFIVSRVSRGERIEHFDTIRQRKDGSRVEISLTVSPIKDTMGRIIGVSKIARDITERRRAENALRSTQEQLARTNDELERRVKERTTALAEAVAQMEEFSYTVSHDLRAPLRGMQVYSQVLLEDYAPTMDPEARRLLERIAENATRLDKMVLDVLTFSRVSRSEIKLERVPLEQLVRSLVQHYPEMQPGRAEIIIDPLADVFGHEPSLTQAISNLLTNAVKFVAPGVQPRIHLWTERREGNVRLWVCDNGIGVNPLYHSRLFRMFERIHPSLPYDGTGVGLAIVRKALTRMGGDAGMESDGVSGSRFWIQLPEPPTDS